MLSQLCDFFFATEVGWCRVVRFAMLAFKDMGYCVLLISLLLLLRGRVGLPYEC